MASGTADVDAIVVPAARTARAVRPAIELARALDCPLVVLCSLLASPAAIEAEANARGVRVYAVSSPTVSRVPRQSTRALLAGQPFSRKTDTAAKRNFGLALAWIAGWERVLFLDDDIEIDDADDIRRAARLLDTYQVVGLDNAGFADNSVVCHAHRDTGGRQGTFIGAGAMLFGGTRAPSSFFPHIFNEDWFFLLDEERLARCAVHGTFAQARFNPYAIQDRAATQEFGDVLAEGLFALLDDGKPLHAADAAFWRDFLGVRGRFIGSILRRLDQAPGLTTFQRFQIAQSLWAARGSLELITPELCAAYMDAWRQDRLTWRTWIEGLPQGLGLAKALQELGAV